MHMLLSVVSGFCGVLAFTRPHMARLSGAAKALDMDLGGHQRLVLALLVRCCCWPAHGAWRSAVYEYVGSFRWVMR
jgi:hypothetical protein